MLIGAELLQTHRGSVDPYLAGALVLATIMSAAVWLMFPRFHPRRVIPDIGGEPIATPNDQGN